MRRHAIDGDAIRWKRPVFIRREFAITIEIERLEARGRVGDFGHRQLAVLVGIECEHDGIDRMRMIDAVGRHGTAGWRDRKIDGRSRRTRRRVVLLHMNRGHRR